MKLISLLLAALINTSALAETQAEFELRQYQAEHLELLRRQARAAEQAPVIIYADPHYQAIGDAARKLSEALDRQQRYPQPSEALDRQQRYPQPPCIVEYGRTYCR
jgi:hypothetical protein